MRLLGSILSILVALSCAKQRPVERIYDTSGTRWGKDAFVKGEDPWLYKVTIVKASHRGGYGFVGMASEAKAGYFQFTRDQLKFVSAVTRYNDPEYTNENVLNSWGITHSEYTRQVSGGKVTNIEVENNKIDWSQKSHFKVDWNNAKITESLAFPGYADSSCWAKRSSELVEGSQEITEEYVGFTVAATFQRNNLNHCFIGNIDDWDNNEWTNTVHFKYSFKRLKPNNYQPYMYTGEFDPLMKKYGYFNTTINGLADNGRYQNHFLMNRWDPTKTHTFYFAEDFPEEYKWIFDDPQQGIFKTTNDMFVKNGLPVRFEIKDNDGSQKFGDLRYSFVKFVTEVDPGAPLGFGPSDVNPFTGEIQSANLVMWTGFLKSYVERLNDRAGRDSNRQDSSGIYRQMKKTLGEDVSSWTETADDISNRGHDLYFNYLLPDYTYAWAGNRYSHHEGPEKMVEFHDFDKIKQYMDMSTHGEFLSKAEEAHHQAVDHLEVERQAMHNPNHHNIFAVEPMFLDADNLLAKGLTPEQVMNAILYRVSIHEFGHNLNLRHNFYGSVDKANFRGPVVTTDAQGNKVEQPATTSSVMDYMHTKDEIYFQLGFENYDEAALVYAYSNGAVDLSKINNTSFLYCTDDHRGVNAMCNTWDSGSKPSEIVASLIENYDEAYYIANFRYDRPYWSTRGYNMRMLRTMLNMKKFVNMYDQTFFPADIQNTLTAIPRLTANDRSSIAQGIRADITRAVLMSAAFYDAVIQLGFTDRPFNDNYDSWSGALTRKGVFEDKLWATRFLLGDDALMYNPDSGTLRSSYLGLRADPTIGDSINEILDRTFLEPGDNYIGVDSWGRILYTLNAANYLDVSFDDGNELEQAQVAIDQLRTVCYKPESFEEKFNIADAFKFYPDGSELIVDTIDVTLNDNADPYFRDKTTRISVIKLNDYYYVADPVRNRLASKLIETFNANDILNTHRVFYLLREGRVPECR